MTAMIAEVQCLPTPMGTDTRPYAHVDAAIEVVREADVRYEVGALGTTFEGDPNVVWPLLRAVHDACLRSGATSVVTVIKVAQAHDAGEQPSIQGLTDAWRAR